MHVSHRVNQVSQGFLEVQDLKEHQDHPVSQVSQEGRVIRATSDSQDSKVGLRFDSSR